MVVQIELRPDLEERLAAEAKLQGLALERYIVERLEGGPPAVHSGPQSVARAVETLRTLRKGNALDGLSIKDLVNEGRRY